MLNRKGLGRTGFLEHTGVCGFVFHVSQRIRSNSLGKTKGIPRTAKTPLKNEPQLFIMQDRDQEAHANSSIT